MLDWINEFLRPVYCPQCNRRLRHHPRDMRGVYFCGSCMALWGRVGYHFHRLHWKGRD